MQNSIKLYFSIPIQLPVSKINISLQQHLFDYKIDQADVIKTLLIDYHLTAAYMSPISLI